MLGTNLLVVCGCHGHSGCHGYGHPWTVAMGTVAVATGVVTSRCAGNKPVGGCSALDTDMHGHTRTHIPYIYIEQGAHRNKSKPT